MNTKQDRERSSGAGRTSAELGLAGTQNNATPKSPQEPKLEELIPIAVVIAAGCEPCAQRMVTKALSQGSSKRHVRKVLGMVQHMQRLDCLRQAVGPEAMAGMERPLAAAQRALVDFTPS